MNFDSFLTHISQLKDKPLGGQPSQFKMAPKMRLNLTEETIVKRKPKASAVLALFYPDGNLQTHFLLMLRASYRGTHSAQISFPGGKKEEDDKDLTYTALRETEEEVGIHKEHISVYRKLTETYIPPSNFWVTPFMGIINHPPIFKPNNEVEKILQIPLTDLLDDKSLSVKNLTTSYMKDIDVPCFLLKDHVVWGATAMILSEIKDLLYTS